jgi:hypothetical protein
MPKVTGKSTYYCCDKIPEKINLKVERFILGCGIRSFGPQLLGSVVSGVMVRKEIMAEEHGKEKLLTL